MSKDALVAPQSSCILNPPAPAASSSTNVSPLLSLALPKNSQLIGNPSIASIIFLMFQGPGVHVVAFVPSAGPVPPPTYVVMPLPMAWYTCCGDIMCTCVSKNPAVAISPSPAVISVELLTTIFSFTLSIVFGFPDFPIPAIIPFLMPMSAFITPNIASNTTTLVITWSRAPSACVVPADKPIPCLALFPPPKTNSSPNDVQSFSTSMTKFVSAN